MYNRILQGLTTEKDAEQFVVMKKEYENLQHQYLQLQFSVAIISFFVVFALIVIGLILYSSTL